MTFKHRMTPEYQTDNWYDIRMTRKHKMTPGFQTGNWYDMVMTFEHRMTPEYQTDNWYDMVMTFEHIMTPGDEMLFYGVVITCHICIKIQLVMLYTDLLWKQIFSILYANANHQRHGIVLDALEEHLLQKACEIIVIFA